MFAALRRLFLDHQDQDQTRLILPVNRQIRAWQKANRKMNWGIPEGAFARIGEPAPLADEDRRRGYIGSVLFYGFGDDGRGHADGVLSGKLAWEYALRRKKNRIWHCEYVHFDRPDHFRMRPGAPPRPKGFYWGKFHPGERYRLLTVSQVRKRLQNETGCGPEGLQFLAITHRHFQERMNEGKIPFMALADYDVAPYGYNDFFDAPQIFVRDGVLALGIGNVDNNYPLFGVPTIRLQRRLHLTQSSF